MSRCAVGEPTEQAGQADPPASGPGHCEELGAVARTKETRLGSPACLDSGSPRIVLMSSMTKAMPSLNDSVVAPGSEPV